MQLFIIKTIVAKRPSSSFILHPSSFLVFLVCALCFGCTSTKPAPAPARPRIEAERSYETGRASYQNQNWSAAAASFGKAADSFAAMDDYRAEATARHNEAQALRRAGRIEEAIAAYQKALAINQRLRHALDQAQNLTGLAQCYRAQKKFDLAIQNCEEALKLSSSSRIVTATIQNDLALTLLQRGNKEDEDRVIKLLKSALESSEAVGNSRARAANYLNLGRAYLQFGKNDSAENSLTKALDAFRAIDDPAGLAQTHEQLAKLYRATANADKAKFHLGQAREKYTFLKDEAGLKRLDQVNP